MKQALLALLGIAFLTTPPAAGQAEDFACSTNNGTLTIIAYLGPGGDVIIPETITGLPVVGIRYYAFVNSSEVTSITIPNSVTNISNGAFRYCYRLVAITAGEYNPTYSSEDGVLFDKNKTKLVAYPAGKAGRDYAIPGSVTSIGIAAFAGYCDTSLTIPGTVTNIGSSAFSSCTSLYGVYFQGNAPSFGGGVFDGDSFATVYYLAGTTGWRPFTGGIPACLWNPLLPYNYTTNNGTITITGYVGPGEALAIPSTITDLPVTGIGRQTFQYRCSPTSVTIPATVTNIEDFLFHRCYALETIAVDPLNASYSSAEGVLFDKSQTVLLQCPAHKRGSYTIPESVASIGIGGFYISSLTDVTIPNSVTTIGDYGFYASVNLATLTIPNRLTSIGNEVFQYCYSLATLTIPKSVTSIGVLAFSRCESLTGVYFEGNAPTLGADAFYAYTPAIIYYLPGTSGWGADFGGRPTAVWQPRVQTGDSSFGVRSNQFGFNIAWASDQTVMVEACTNLASSAWVPLRSLNLTNGQVYFSDPDWTNHSTRLYRLRSP